MMAVLGTMSTGGGSAQLTTVLSTMGILSMSKGTFVTTERLLGDFLKNELTVKMMEAGQQEREMPFPGMTFIKVYQVYQQ